MGLFDNWPYSDVHQLNLDWILKVVKEIKGKTDDIDAAVETAQQEAEAASQSEINAAAARDATEQYYNQTVALTAGSPKVAELAADMTDTDLIYIYVGSEEGYNSGDWYYYDGSDWVDGGQYGGDSGIPDNARNLLKYILEHVAYTDPGMQVYVDALYNALAQTGTVTTTYTVTNALVNVTNSNTDSGVDAGDSYSGVLTPDSGYVMDTVVITMGGVDITSSAYNNGVISIAIVTGDIVITAEASAILYWDYEWNSSSGVAPTFMTYSSCTFAADNSYATIHMSNNTDLFVLSDVGDMEMEFAVGFPGTYNNNPQFVVRTSATGGFKVFPGTNTGVVSTNISGSTASLSVADRTAINIYKMHIVSGSCSLEYGPSEDSLTELTGPGQTESTYYTKTGVTGAQQAAGYDLNLSYFRYKKL